MSNDTYDIALTIEEAKEMNLLDEVKFKYFKDYCEDDFIYGTAEYIIDSDILIGKNEVNIKLKFDWNEGIQWQEVEIHRIYSTSSPFALKMLDWIREEEEEEEEDYICDNCCCDEEEEEQKELPEDLKEWVLENMKAVEEHTLEEDKAMLFIKLLEENQHNPTFIKLYDEYEKSKKEEEEN